MSEAPRLSAFSDAISLPAEATRDAELLRIGQRDAGVLTDVAGWLAGVQDASPPHPPRRPVLLVPAAEPPSAVATLADELGVSVRPAELPDGLVAGTAAVELGQALADAEADGGTDLLLLAGSGAGGSLAARVLVAALTRTDAAAAVGQTGTDDAGWIREVAAVRDAMRDVRPHLGDPPELLAAAGDPALAVLTGVLLQSAARRTPVVLDGLTTTAAALVGQRVAFRAAPWWLAAHSAPDAAHDLALQRLRLRPLLALGLRADDGTGPLLALPVLRVAGRR